MLSNQVLARRQSYYNKLVTAAKNGTFPSFLPLTESGPWGCMYRNGEKKCAIGILIKDEEYESNAGDLEGYRVRLLPRNIVDKCVERSGLSSEELGKVQSTHDLMAEFWDIKTFVSKLNYLSFFEDIEKVAN